MVQAAIFKKGSDISEMFRQLSDMDQSVVLGIVYGLLYAREDQGATVPGRHGNTQKTA